MTLRRAPGLSPPRSRPRLLDWGEKSLAAVLAMGGGLLPVGGALLGADAARLGGPCGGGPAADGAGQQGGGDGLAGLALQGLLEQLRAQGTADLGREVLDLGE